MPTPLQDAELEAPLDLFDRSSHNTPRTYLLNSAGKRRAISASRLMIHRDLRDRMHAVIPPRSVRIRTKLFWKLVFLMMRMPYGSALLLRRYGG